jgi:hypothetical protein
MDAMKRSHRLRALGLALVASLAIAATSAGSASALSLTPVAPATYPVSLSLNAPWTVTFTGSTEANEIKCESATGTGQLTSGTAGTLKVTYKGCKTALAATCTGPGQAAGTIVTPNLAITPVYLDAAKTKWGLKLEPVGTNVWAECNSTFFGIPLFNQITGNGVLGNVWNILGSTTKTLNLHQEWGSTWTEQQYQQIEGAGTKYHLQQTAVNKSNGNEISSDSALWLENPITTGASVTINP